VHIFIWSTELQYWLDWSDGLPTSGTAELAQLCDMNADGDMDLAVFGTAVFQLWLGDGKKTWTADASFTTQADGYAHAFRAGGDIDHNGKPDLALLVEIGDWISYQNYLKCYKESSPVFTLSIKPVYPYGNEFFWQNCIRDIQWVSAVPAGQSSTVTLELSAIGPDGPYNTIAENIPNNGSYQWLVPMENSLNCYIRYTVMTANDTTSAVTPAAFTISDGTAGSPDQSMEDDLIRVFPNPATGSLNIESISGNNNSTISSLRITDILGRTRFSTEINLSFPVTLDLSGWAEGVYFIRIFSDDSSSSTLKFIISR
jgi:hypothetical protein